MSLFNKNIDEMTFDDIKSFIDQGNNERVILEYKKEWTNNEKMAKEMSSFANTYGGLILVGVDEPRNGRPCEIVGVNNNESWNEKITSIALRGIEPPIVPQIGIIPIPQSDRVIVIIRISESVHAPHTIENKTKTYYRINKQSEPIQEAPLDKILWLHDRRNKSFSYKGKLIDRSRERSENLFGKDWAVKTIYTIPAFPIEELISLNKLKDTVAKLNVISLINVNDIEKRTADESIIFYKKNISYLEINSAGMIYCKTLFDKNIDKTEAAKLDTWQLIDELIAFVVTTMKFYKTIGYWGSITIGHNFINIKNTCLVKPGVQIDNSYYMPQFDNELSTVNNIKYCLDEASIYEFINNAYNKYCWIFNDGVSTKDNEVNLMVTEKLREKYDVISFEQILRR